MKMSYCEREQELVEALTSGRWPDACGEELRSHAARCSVCADVVLVAQALEQENARARAEMALPGAGLVWWKAQIRARREAAEQATQPIAIVERLAWVCGLLCLLGAVVWQRSRVEDWFGWFTQTARLGRFGWSGFWAQGIWPGPWNLALITVVGAGFLVSFLLYAVLADR